MAHLQISQLIPAPRFETFDYLTNPSNLPQLLQPIVQAECLTPNLELKRGVEIHFMMTRYGLSQSVRFRVEDVVKGSRMTYRQVEGLFATWTHTTRFDEHAAAMTLVTDLVDYRLPMGLLGHLANDLIVKSDMKNLLGHRLNRAKEHFTQSSGP
ncbi:MAG: hypothetical protein AB7G93_15550 [Bdellovibrionales bacterium]